MLSINLQLWETVVIDPKRLPPSGQIVDQMIESLFKLKTNQSAELFYGDCLQKHMFRDILHEFLDERNLSERSWPSFLSLGLFERIRELSHLTFKFEANTALVKKVRRLKFDFKAGSKNNNYNREALPLPLTHPNEMMRFLFDKTAPYEILFNSSDPVKELTLTGIDACRSRLNFYRSLDSPSYFIRCVHGLQPWTMGEEVPDLARFFLNWWRDWVNPRVDPLLPPEVNLLWSLWTKRKGGPDLSPAFLACIGVRVERPSPLPLIESVFNQEKMQMKREEITAKAILQSSFYVLLTDIPVGQILDWDRMYCYGWARAADQAANATTDKEFYLRIADQIVLYQIIERIGMVNRESNGWGKSDFQLMQLKWLGWMFDEIYQRIKESQVSASLSMMIKSEMTALLTFGLIETKIVPIQEFRLKRELADLGYSFSSEVSNILQTEFPELHNGTFELVKDLLMEFQNWAGEYPDQALDMMSCIWHAAGVLQAEDVTTRIQTGLTGKYFTHSLLSAMGESNRKREMDQRKYLKFVCLWEFCHYLPYLAKILKEGVQFNPQDGLLGVGFRIGKLVIDLSLVNAEKRVIHAVPGEWAANVALIAEAVRGESLYHILQTNAQLQLLGVAGQIGGFLWNPGNLTSLIKIEFLNWWRPLKSLSARVAAIHIGIPLAGMAGLSLSLMSLPLIPGVIVGLSLAVMSYQLYKYLRTPDPENYAKVMLRDRELRGEVKREVSAYLNNAKRLYSVVQVHSNVVGEKGDASKVLKALKSEVPTTASEAVKCFNKALKGEEDSIICKVEQEWLQPILTEIFMKEACQFYLEKKHASELELPIPGKREWSSDEIRSLVCHQLGTRCSEAEAAIQSIF